MSSPLAPADFQPRARTLPKIYFSFLHLHSTSTPPSIYTILFSEAYPYTNPQNGRLNPTNALRKTTSGKWYFPSFSLLPLPPTTCPLHKLTSSRSTNPRQSPHLPPHLPLRAPRAPSPRTPQTTQRPLLLHVDGGPSFTSTIPRYGSLLSSLHFTVWDCDSVLKGVLADDGQGVGEH